IGTLVRATYAVYANANNITVFAKTTCLKMNSLQTVGACASQVILVAIAFDRFMAVFRPLAYSKNNSRLFFYAVAVVGISMGLLFAVIVHIGVDDSVPITVCSVGPAMTRAMIQINIAWSGTFLFLLFCKFISMRPFPNFH
ncbi:hypothetical protein FO519_009796, partial [Halicephalobus sp. NKZ332]